MSIRQRDAHRVTRCLDVGLLFAFVVLGFLNVREVRVDRPGDLGRHALLRMIRDGQIDCETVKPQVVPDTDRQRALRNAVVVRRNLIA